MKLDMTVTVDMAHTPINSSHLVGMTPTEKQRYRDRAQRRTHRADLGVGAVELLERYPWEVMLTITFSHPSGKGRALHSAAYCERHADRFLGMINGAHGGNREKGPQDHRGVAFALAWERHKSRELHLHALGLGAPDGWWKYTYCRQLAIEDRAIGRSFDITGITDADRAKHVRYVAKYITKDLQGFDVWNPGRLKRFAIAPPGGLTFGPQGEPGNRAVTWAE